MSSQIPKPTRPLIEYNSTYPVRFTLPENPTKFIDYQVYIEDGRFGAEWIRCDLCNLPIRLYGKPDSRNLSGLADHRGEPDCDIEKRRAVKRETAEAMQKYFEPGSLGNVLGVYISFVSCRVPS